MYPRIGSLTTPSLVATIKAILLATDEGEMKEFQSVLKARCLLQAFHIGDTLSDLPAMIHLNVIYNRRDEDLISGPMELDIDAIVKWGARWSRLCRDKPLLYRAVSTGHLEILRVMMRLGSRSIHDPKRATKFLYLAVELDQIEIFNFILELHPKLIDAVEQRSLQIAAKYNAIKCMSYLLRRNPTLQPGILGRSVFHIAANRGHISVLEVLLQKYKLGTSMVDNYGRNPFHYAAIKGHSNVIELLVRFRIPGIDTIHADGGSPIRYALDFKRPECAKTLKALGANTNICTQGMPVRRIRLLHKHLDEEYVRTIRFRVYFTETLTHQLLECI